MKRLQIKKAKNILNRPVVECNSDPWEDNSDIRKVLTTEREHHADIFAH